MKPCPYCAELVADDAVTCPQCGSDARDFGGGRRRQDDDRRPPKSALGRWVILGVLIAFGMLALVLLLQPAVARHTPAGEQTSCKNNLKQIGLALHNYHDRYGLFPPAYVADEHGRPLYSWRVLVLEFTDYADVYRRFDKTKAWDDPANLPLLEQMPATYACPSAGEPAMTTSYAAVFGPRCVFRGGEGTKLREITDGTPNTAIVGEVHGRAIPWTAPVDVDVRWNPSGFSSPHTGGGHFLFADGTVHFVEDSMHPQTLMWLFEKDDG